MGELSFDDDDLAKRIDALTDDERHALEFGLVGLKRDGTVRFFSRTEAMQSGFGERRTFGRDFFAVIAPCMNGDDVRGLIQQAVDEGAMDIEIGHTGDFADPARLVRLRAMSAADGNIWLAIQR